MKTKIKSGLVAIVVAVLLSTSLKSFGRLYPNMWDCRSFYECRGGNLILYICPNDLYYCAELDWCDWPSKSVCTFDCMQIFEPEIVTAPPLPDCALDNE